MCQEFPNTQYHDGGPVIAIRRVDVLAHRRFSPERSNGGRVHPPCTKRASQRRHFAALTHGEFPSASARQSPGLETSRRFPDGRSTNRVSGEIAGWNSCVRRGGTTETRKH